MLTNVPKSNGLLKYIWFASLAWAMAVGTLRTWSTASCYAKVQWLTGYEIGWVKRGVPGTLFSILQKLMPNVPTLNLLNFVTIAIYICFGFCLLYSIYILVLKRSYSIISILSTTLFTVSSFWVMQANLMGFYDHIVFITTIICIHLVLNDKLLPVVILSSICVFVHETFILTGLPIIIFAIIHSMQVTAKKTKDSSRLIKYAVLTSAIPILLFLVQSVMQGAFYETNELTQRSRLNLRSYEFMDETCIRSFPELLNRDVLSFLKTELIYSTQRLFNFKNFSEQFATIASYLLLIVGTIGLNKKRYLAFIVFTIGIPQSLHLIAWDTARIWSYSVLLSFLSLYIILFYSNKKFSFNKIIIYTFLFILVFLFTIVQNFYLLNKAKDHLLIAERVWLYLPVIICTLALCYNELKHLIKQQVYET